MGKNRHTGLGELNGWRYARVRAQFDFAGPRDNDTFVYEELIGATLSLESGEWRLALRGLRQIWWL